MDERKRYTSEEKVAILREVLEEGKSVSAVAEEHGLHPNNIFKWKKQLFEGAMAVFTQKRPDISVHAEKQKITELEARLAGKDEVIAELAAENLALKKKNTGLMPGGGK
jgi:transposase-like protein